MAKKSMIAKQQREPKFSTRYYNRCKICGRPHSYMRKYLSIETFIHGFSWISLSLLTVVVLGTHYLLLNMIIFMITAIILSLMEQAILYYVLRREKNNLC
mgnify:CR=1 FL=1